MKRVNYPEKRVAKKKVRAYKTVDDILYFANKLNIPVDKRIFQGEKDLDWIKIQILNPTETKLNDHLKNWENNKLMDRDQTIQNTCSITFSIKIKEWNGLFTGDSKVYDYFDDIKDEKWDFIKINHHGSKHCCFNIDKIDNIDDSTESLFDLKCEYFGLLGGKEKHGNPSERVIKSLNDKKVKLIKTKTGFKDSNDNYKECNFYHNIVSFARLTLEKPDFK
jgi:hypothetical protein